MHMARDWMTSPAIVIDEMAALPEARRLMRERAVRRLPVVDAAGRLVGIVTEGDVHSISRSAETDVVEYNMYYTRATLPVREFMTRAVVTATPATPIAEVARALYDHRIGGLPVLDGDRLVGVITERDLFRCLMSLEESAFARSLG